MRETEIAGSIGTAGMRRSQAPAADLRNGDPLSAEERRTKLERAVQNGTREARGSVRIHGEFDALLVQGTPVNHRLHLVSVLVLAVLGLAIGQVLGIGQALGIDPLVVAAVVPGAYAAFWLFLALTGGEELHRISIDERGKLSSARWGRVVTRSDFLRVAIPGLIIAISGCIAVWLFLMIVFPPPPRCNLGDPYALPVGCNAFPGLSGDLRGGDFLSVDQTQLMETIFRGYALAVDLVFLLPATGFVACMLTGRRVLGVEPVRRHRNDD